MKREIISWKIQDGTMVKQSHFPLFEVGKSIIYFSFYERRAKYDKC